MTQFTTSKGEYVIFEVPKGNFDFKISIEIFAEDENNKSSILYWEFSKDGYKELPQGSWQFLCTTDTISEEVADDIMGFDDPLLSAIEFAFLLDSINLSPNKNYAICKKN